MDPHVWATIAELWWIGPLVIAAGGLGWLGLRRERKERARRIAYDAAKLDVRAARQRLAAARSDVKVARADLATAQAERSASQGTSAAVADARLRLQQAQRDLKAASAAVRAGRARVTAARAALPSAATPADQLPLARLTAQHDAVTARWMAYETDPARALAFPAMSDGRQPLTAAYLTLQAEAMRLRPRDAVDPKGTRMTAADFAAYREVVVRLERAFDAAEADAWRLARAAGTAPNDATGPRADSARSGRGALPEWVGLDPATAAEWGGLARDVLARSVESLTRATEAAAAALEARRGGPTGPDAAPAAPGAHRPGTPARADTHDQARAHDLPADESDADSPTDARRAGSGDEPPSWPVPRRG